MANKKTSSTSKIKKNSSIKTTSRPKPNTINVGLSRSSRYGNGGKLKK